MHGHQGLLHGSAVRRPAVLDGIHLAARDHEISAGLQHLSFGDQELAIGGGQVGGDDPVPQAGSYNLLTPKNKKLGLSFQRVDEDTIKVTVSNGKRSFNFDVSKIGTVKSS